LLALGFGLVVWELTRHLPSAALTAFASAFIGFFVYRVNHPAIFSLCAAPWMLYGWTRIAGSRSLRSILAWTGLLLLASWAELTSGTVKETLALLLCTNLAGVLLLACSPRPRTFRLQAFGVALAAGVAFALLAAPLWMTFWETLRQSYNSYDNVAVHQAPPALLIGFFDELFYRPLSPMHTVFCPAVNFLFLMGGLCFVAAPGHRTHNRPLLALAVAALVPFVLAFGLVPACWIRAVPLLRNIGHINNTFSCVLILLFIPVAGAGFHAAWLRLGKAGGRGDAARVLSLLGVLLCLFLAGDALAPGNAFWIRGKRLCALRGAACRPLRAIASSRRRAGRPGIAVPGRGLCGQHGGGLDRGVRSGGNQRTRRAHEPPLPGTARCLRRRAPVGLEPGGARRDPLRPEAGLRLSQRPVLFRLCQRPCPVGGWARPGDTG
jgi:hypothetical protein